MSIKYIDGSQIISGTMFGHQVLIPLPVKTVCIR